MDHERAFLQAIREEPDEDAHRLIYADWLEEQGGSARTERAAFIRAQTRLASLPEDDPHRDALEDEAADLLADHEDEWTQPLRGIAQEWRFSRGFIENVTIRGEDFLTHGERLLAFAPMRSVHLLIGPKDIPALAACPSLQWIETLDFRRCHLNDRALQQLLSSPYVTRLKALDLTGNGITTAGMQSLVQSTVFPRLRRLDLSRNNGIGDKAVHLLSRASVAENLQDLSLEATRVTLGGLDELFHSSHLPRVAVLNVSVNCTSFADLTSPLRIFIESKLLGQLRSLNLNGFLHPAVCSNLLSSLRSAHLEALYLRSAVRGKEDARLLAKSPNLARLKVLDLGHNQLGAEGARMLADLPHLTSLRSLDLRSNNVCDDGAAAIAASGYLSRLSALDLTQNHVGGPGLKALVASDNLRRLSQLVLIGNFINADSLRALGKSTHLRHLTQLDLSDTHLDETCARALAECTNLSRLHTLLLEQNQIGDTGAKALAQSRHLTQLSTLSLRNNRIGKDGAEALAAAALWRRLSRLDLADNVFTDTEEALLRRRFGDAVVF
jgi:uncharacterized protein (TIGR02996 family)